MDAALRTGGAQDRSQGPTLGRQAAGREVQFTLFDVAVQKPFQYQSATAVCAEVAVVVLGVCNDGKRLLHLKRLGRSGKLQLC